MLTSLSVIKQLLSVKIHNKILTADGDSDAMFDVCYNLKTNKDTLKLQDRLAKKPSVLGKIII